MQLRPRGVKATGRMVMKLLRQPLLALCAITAQNKQAIYGEAASDSCLIYLGVHGLETRNRRNMTASAPAAMYPDTPLRPRYQRINAKGKDGVALLNMDGQCQYPVVPKGRGTCLNARYSNRLAANDRACNVTVLRFPRTQDYEIPLCRDRNNYTVSVAGGTSVATSNPESWTMEREIMGMPRFSTTPGLDNPLKN